MIVISGPCVIDERTEETASLLYDVVKGLDIEFYFKASFDKANRTSLNSYRGPGLYDGLHVLEWVKASYGFKITTDVHEFWQIGKLAGVVDLIQIPALLCRQTNLLIEAGRQARAVNIKKGQFMAPEDMAYAVEKVRGAGCKNVYVTERGASFGYHRLVVDMLSFPILKTTGARTIFDCTHSLQLPAAGGGCSASLARDYAPILAKAAIAAGAEGIFAEVYPEPDKAKCDGPNSLSIKQFETLLTECNKIMAVLA